jgi:dUTP pyrophosphatase
MFRGL